MLFFSNCGSLICVSKNLCWSHLQQWYSISSSILALFWYMLWSYMLRSDKTSLDVLMCTKSNMAQRDKAINIYFSEVALQTWDIKCNFIDAFFQYYTRWSSCTIHPFHLYLSLCQRVLLWVNHSLSVDEIYQYKFCYCYSLEEVYVNSTGGKKISSINIFVKIRLWNRVDTVWREKPLKKNKYDISWHVLAGVKLVRLLIKNC